MNVLSRTFRVSTQTRFAAVCLLTIFVLLISSILEPSPVAAAGNIGGATCNETDLQTAIDAGGVVDFTADCTINLTSQINITTAVTINGNGYEVILDGGNSVRVMNINASPVVLDGLTIQNGSTFAGSGGGIFHSGELTVRNSTFQNNQSGSRGGAIYSNGTLLIENSTFDQNIASELGGRH